MNHISLGFLVIHVGENINNNSNNIIQQQQCEIVENWINVLIAIIFNEGIQYFWWNQFQICQGFASSWNKGKNDEKKDFKLKKWLLLEFNRNFGMKWMQFRIYEIWQEYNRTNFRPIFWTNMTIEFCSFKISEIFLVAS